MPNAFNFAASPFDCLNPEEQRLVRDSVDVVYFREGETILAPGSTPTHLFVIIKGYVTQLDGDEIINSYGPDDCFDGRGLVAGRVSSRFVAAEEVVAYELARQAVNSLIASNSTFGALLFADLSHKLSALAARTDEHEQHSLAMARVDEAPLRPAPQVDAQTDILSVVRLLQAHRTANVLVSDTTTTPPRLGIFTVNALQQAVLDGRPLDQLPVGELAGFPLITVRPSDQLGDAMVLMLRHRVHRVVVIEEGTVLGVLESLDLFSFLSDQSHLITVRIEEANDLDELAVASGQITRMIARLYRNGSRVQLIARLVQQLNERLFERAWQLIAPPELVANSCLIVMGSEGRGEQLLKTDQDNGLILRDGYSPPADLPALCERFSQALQRFGYPECPGHVMVSTPQWRQSAGEFARMAREWLVLPGADSLMQLAIFMDAHAVCGDAALLEQVRRGLLDFAVGNDAVQSRFAAAVESFGNGSGGWWQRLLGRGEADASLHMKKEGIFPLVHGVRSLALAYGLSETSTAARIDALVAAGALEPALGAALADSLYFFMGLRLKAGLDEMALERPVTGTVDPARLSSLDRDLLKDTLAVVRRFKAQLHHRFHLDVV